MLNLTTRLEQILVVKIGGGAGLDIARCLQDVARLARQRPVVVVHGVSAVMDALCAERGLPVRTITSPNGHSSRYTDPSTRDVFVEAAGRVNDDLVHGLQAQGIDAVGVSGVIYGERKAAIRALVDGRRVIIRDDYSGTITGVNAGILFDCLERGQVVVLPPLAISDDGFLNIDGDRGAAAVASALGAADFVILSNVRGLYRQFGQEDSFITRVSRHQIDAAMNYAQGRMKRKVLGASEALAGGVHRVIIADGRLESPIQAALQGVGTEFLA
ncbi:MAG: [LysW]-aminoadipate kinase [Anaerolineae bacterium]